MREKKETNGNGGGWVDGFLRRNLLAVLAVLVATITNYQANVARLDSLEARAERIEHGLEEHDRGYTHHSWFGPGGVLHPALMRGIEGHYRECSERDHAPFERAEFARTWRERLFELNTDLKRPTGF